MNKIVIITGLTGSGKSALALDIAQKFGGEIISADSVQVYRGLNIGSAKESQTELKLVPHHLIDILNFNQNYNVGSFLSDCKNCIEDVVSRGKLPIIVGGTGMYVKALIDGYTLGDVANLEFRQTKQTEAEQHGNMYVWEQLNKINPQKAEQVHPNNLKRVIRYLELETSGKQPTGSSILCGYQVCAVGIVADREQLYDKINKRVDKMLAEGLKNEVEGLISRGASADMQAMNSIGYSEWFDYFAGKQTYETTVDLIKQHTRNYCKRQLTFLKTINGLQLATLEEAKHIIETFVKN